MKPSSNVTVPVPASNPGTTTLQLPAAGNTIIRVAFNRDLDPATVQAFGGNAPNASFRVLDPQGKDVFCTLAGVSGGDASIVIENGLLQRRTTYRVIVHGDPDPSAPQRLMVRAADGTRLDGEPVALPSGDGFEGGNFSFEFHAV